MDNYVTEEQRTYTKGKDNLFNKQYWENWTATCQRMKVDYNTIEIHKIHKIHIKQLKLIV